MTKPTQNIEIILGNYLEAFNASIPKSLHTSAEVQAKRVEYNKRKDNPLNQWFYTANTPLYGMDGKTAIHLFGGKEAFLKLYAPHIDAVYDQIVNGKNNVYTLPPEDAQLARTDLVGSGALKQFDLKSLIQKKDNDEWGYYVINPAQPNKLKGERRAHAELVHGQGDAFYATMEMLVKAGIIQTNVYLLNSQFVKKSCAEKGQIVGRGAGLNGMISNSIFLGGARSLGSHDAFLGVRSSSGERSEPSSVECPQGAPENKAVPSAPSALQEVRRETMEEILSLSLDYVPTIIQKDYLDHIRQKITEK